MTKKTLYLTRDICGDLLLHERLPRRDQFGLWASDGDMQEVEPHTLLHCLLFHYCEAVRAERPVAIEVRTDWSSVNSLLRSPV